MKKLIIAISILTIILVAGILETIYIHKIFNRIDDMLIEAEAAISVESEESALLIDKLSEVWEEKRKYMELFTFSPDLRVFSAAIGETQGSLQCGDFNNALSKCKSLIIMSKNIHQILDFNIEDII